MLQGKFWQINKIRYLEILFSFLAIISKSYSQSQIHGTVINMNRQPIAFATILLLKSNDSTLVKGVMTSHTGTFEITKVDSGKYFVSCSYAEYKQVFSDSFIIKNKSDLIDLGVLLLTPKENKLSAVTILTKKPLFEQKMDRLVINVSSSITSAGSSALEVLEKSPGIIIDQNNNILSLNGKEGVVLMINGIINRMPLSGIIQMLASMNAGNIERIELIATPPSNYDAGGNAGYINIIFKSNLQFGTNGSYSLTSGYGKGLISEGSINFNNRKNKLNLFGDFSLTRINSAQFYAFYHKVSNKGKSTDTYSDVKRDLNRFYYSGKIGLDYEINKRTILGVLFSEYDNKVTIHSQNETKITIDQHLDTTLHIENKDINEWANISANLNFLHTYSSNDKITLNLNYDYYKADNPDTYVNSYYDALGKFLFDRLVNSYKKTPIKVYVFAADYFKKINSKTELESGIKSTFSTFTNEVEIDRLLQNIWVRDGSLSGRYNLEEKILAAYSSIRIAFNNKTNMKMGLRYEYTLSNLNSDVEKNIIDSKYGKLFPSLFFSHSINENHIINFSYSHRITRPVYNDMAPFLIFYDPYTQVAGNPALKPSITDIINTSYSFKRKIVSLLYSYDMNPITNFSPKVDSVSNKETLAPANQKNRKTFSIGISLPAPITKWWTMQAYINGIWQQMNAYLTGNDIQIQQEYINITSTQSFMFSQNFSCELSGTFISGGISGVYRNKPYGFLNFGAQKKLVRSRSILRFNIYNILNSMIRNNIINRPDYNLVVTGRLRIAYPSFRLTYIHNFGNDKINAKRNRITGAEEEKERIITQ